MVTLESNVNPIPIDVEVHDAHISGSDVHVTWDPYGTMPRPAGRRIRSVSPLARVAGTQL